MDSLALLLAATALGVPSSRRVARPDRPADKAKKRRRKATQQARRAQRGRR